MKRGIISGVLAAANVALVLTAFTAEPRVARPRGPQATQAVAESSAAHDEAGLWHVELSSPPTADGTSDAVLEQEEAAFHAEASAAGIGYLERRHFRSLWNGLTLSLSATDADKLRGLVTVKTVYPVIRVTRLQGPAQTEGQVQTGADLVRAAGITGAGVHVALIDSGIDWQHPDLGGCFGSGCRVTRGFDFVDNDSDPDDCNGHGTHVAGIIGAKGPNAQSVQGMAPNVTFGAYRVFGCEGSADTDIVLAAMERVLNDGADVLNMSLGPAMNSLPSDFQWSQSPVARAADRLVRRGTVVVAAIGDRGMDGLYAADAPGVGSRVIGVASFEPYMVFTISPDNTRIIYHRATGSPLAPLADSVPITPTLPVDACAGLGPGSLVGKVALVRRGGCTHRVKVDNAVLAGAVGVVIYDINDQQPPYVAMVSGPPVSIPVVTIAHADGEAIDARLAAGPVTMRWTREGGGLISGFSSYGLAPDLSVKPDIGAPGGRVWSTLPRAMGGYGYLSGSSMASAHTAGAVALLVEARRKAAPRGRGKGEDEGGSEGNGRDEDGAGWARTALLNSAEPRLWGEDPSFGLLDQVHRQGAGMLRIDRAIAALVGLRVTPATLALGESQVWPATRTVRITNDGRSRVTYDLSHAAALVTLPDTFVPVADYHPATVGFSRNRVTLERGESAEIRVTIRPPGSELEDKSLYGGYLVFTPRGGGPAVRVAYAGFKGDYQSIRASSAPWLAKWNGSSYTDQPGGASYTMVGNDIPVIRLHLDHPVRRVRVQVFDAKGKSQALATDSEYLGRNRTSEEFFDLKWSGKTFEQTEDDGRRSFRTLKNGVYSLRIEVLKALGDSRSPAHIERWTAPAITIARP